MSKAFLITPFGLFRLCDYSLLFVILTTFENAHDIIEYRPPKLKMAKEQKGFVMKQREMQQLSDWEIEKKVVIQTHTHTYRYIYLCVFWVISYTFVLLCMPCPLCACLLVCTGKEKSGAKTVMIWGPVQCQEYCGCLTNSGCVTLCNFYSGCVLQSSNPSPFSRNDWPRSVGMLLQIPPWWGILTYATYTLSRPWKMWISYWLKYASKAFISLLCFRKKIKNTN